VQGIAVYSYSELAVSDTLDYTHVIGSLLRQLVKSMAKLSQETEDFYLNSQGQRPDQCMLGSLLGDSIRKTDEPIYILIGYHLH
jgi:hypothetical protein